MDFSFTVKRLHYTKHIDILHQNKAILHVLGT